MLGKKTDKQTIYLNVAYGHLMRYMGKGQNEEPYDSVKGVITAIKTVTKTIKNRPYRYLYVYMTDGEDNYAIQVPLLKSAGPNIVRSLKAALDQKHSLKGCEVEIQTYAKEKDDTTYTNAVVYVDGEKMPWTEISKNQDFQETIEDLATELRLHFQNADGGDPGDMPADENNES